MELESARDLGRKRALARSRKGMLKPIEKCGFKPECGKMWVRHLNSVRWRRLQDSTEVDTSRGECCIGATQYSFTSERTEINDATDRLRDRGCFDGVSAMGMNQSGQSKERRSTIEYNRAHSEVNKIEGSLWVPEVGIAK